MIKITKTVKMVKNSPKWSIMAMTKMTEKMSQKWQK